MAVAELVEGLRAPAPAERWSALTGTPLLAVDLQGDDPPAPDLAALARALATLPCACVGLASAPLDRLPRRAAAVLDIVLASDGDEPTLPEAVRNRGGLEATLAALHERAQRWPRATAAAAVLLRGGERRAPLDGLVAESTVYSTLQGGPEFAAWRAGRPVRTVAADAEPPVLVGRNEATLQITLNRPLRHNAYGTAMRDHLAAALELAAADPEIDRIILEGAGPSFCSGGDLDEFGTTPDPATAHLVRLTRSPAQLLVRLGHRVEVHLHGACVGAGIELPAFARQVVAAPDAVIRLPELELGLVPGAGGTVSLPRRIGRQRTAYLALSGAPIDAPTALAWGLVDEIG